MELREGYKKTEVGVIPEDWIEISLGELGKFKNGINKTKEDFGHGFPFVNLLDIFGVPKLAALENDLGLVNTSPAERELYDLKCGDILFVRSSVKPQGVGLTTVIPRNLEETVFSGFLIRFRDSGQLNLAYKEYCFHEEGIRSRIISSSTVSANTNINQDALKQLKLGLPSNKEEQCAIAHALSDMDALLEGLDRLIAKKRDIKQAAMQQLLTGKTRLPGFEGEWEVIALSEGLSSNPEYGINAPAVPYSDRLFRYIRITDINEDGYFDPPTLVSVNSRDAESYLLEGGDIVLARTGASVGKSYQYRSMDGRLVFAGFLIRVHPDDLNLNARYVSSYLKTDAYWRWVRLMSMRSGQPGINGNEYARLPIPKPSIDEQRAIATILCDMDAEIEALQQRRAKTRDLKQAMMQELLTGKTRLI